ncbi:MAG: YggS family pyridoxal phosphate-dependent enzyme [Azospirillum sp.]|nr:YggS family pyridoxal phosphate-dependent enzyme [Azospirillum sp.]
MIETNLKQIRVRIDAAASAAQRDPADVTLVAVAKTYGPDAVEAALAAGQRVFGENRVQEAQGKYPPFKARHPDLDLHLIGPLQTNKVKEAVALFDAIHTLDRPKLAAALANEIARTGKRPALFVQVNTGAEPQKAGIMPDSADAFIAACREVHGLTIAGLMCIPPVADPPAPHFAFLAEMAKRNGLAHLSMGMSGDYETAIALGATHIRVGSAIFGARG